MPRPRRRQPDPARFPPCARCGQCYPGGADSWPEGRACKYCYLQARLRTGTCAGCGALTSLPGLNATGQPACPRCSGIPPPASAAAAAAGARLPPGLLAGGLVSMRRPQSGVVWLRRSAITRETLRDLARDRIPCSHAALDAGGGPRCRIPALPAGPVRRAAAPRSAPGRLPALGCRQARRHRQCRAPPATRTVPPLAPPAPPAVRQHHRAARPRPLPAGQAAPHRGHRLPGMAGRPRAATR
jgi:hypothetical protein